MVFILIARCEMVIAGLAVIIAGLAITISCHEPNFTMDSGGMRWGSGVLPAGAILVGVMGDGMGMEARAGAIVRVATAQIIAAAGCNCL